MSAHAMPANPGKRKLTLRRAVDDGFTYLALTVVSSDLSAPLPVADSGLAEQIGQPVRDSRLLSSGIQPANLHRLFTDDVNGLIPTASGS